MAPPSPPSCWRLLLGMLLPRELRDAVVGELDACYGNQLSAGVSRAVARRWYRGQVVRTLGPALRNRLGVVARGLADGRRGAPDVARRSSMLDGLMQDMRLGCRRLLRVPGFLLLSVAILSLGIAVTTTVFSIVHEVVIEPLPFPEAHQLYRVYGRNEDRGWLTMSVSAPNYLDLSHSNETFESLAAYVPGSGVLTGAGDAERLRIGRVTPNLFPLLGILPRLGRNFLPEEGSSDQRSRVALLSHAFHARHFGPDAPALGTVLILGGEPHVVVGVLPAGEDYLEWNDVYVPLVPDPGGSRANNTLVVTGRLRHDVGIDRARSEMNALATRIAEEFPEGNPMTGVTLESYRAWLLGHRVPSLLIVLLCAVGLVFLVACANLAGLLLTRAVGRSREVAIMAALGAGRGRVVRQLLIESSILAAAGGAVGVLLALWCLGLVKQLDPGTIPRLAGADISGGVLVFSLGATAFVAVVAGAFPAFGISRIGLMDALKEGGPGSVGGGRPQRVRRALVVAELALTTALLLAAGLMVRSLLEVQRQDRGFATDGRLLFEVALPRGEYGDRDVLRGFFNRFLDRLEGLPIASAGAVSIPPLDPWPTNMPILAEGTAPGAGEGTPVTEFRYVTPGYFRAMGLEVLNGRIWDDLGREEFEAGVVISRSLADALWPATDPIGKRVLLRADANLAMPVIGVVSDQLERGLERGPMSIVYFSFGGGFRDLVTFVVHASNDPAQLVPAIRAALREIDPNLPVSNPRFFEDVVRADMAERRMLTFAFAVFALVTLVLACAGIYGSVAWSVSQRKPEFAVRLTMGALPGDVIRLVVGQGMRITMLGLGVGVVVSAGLSRFLQGLLFQVGPHDPSIWITVTLALASASLLACLLPAFRASRVPPMKALRED